MCTEYTLIEHTPMQKKFIAIWSIMQRYMEYEDMKSIIGVNFGKFQKAFFWSILSILNLINFGPT